MYILILGFLIECRRYQSPHNLKTILYLASVIQDRDCYYFSRRVNIPTLQGKKSAAS